MPKKAKVFIRRYLSHLTDAQGSLLDPLFGMDLNKPARTYSPRDCIDALFYLNRSGCAWRYLPQNLPPGRTPSTTSTSGRPTVPGRGSTPPSADGSGLSPAGIRIRPPAA